MLASRTFTEADQIQFAAVSGDCNPIHLEAVLARHLLLWALDVMARAEAGPAPVRRLEAQSKRFVALGETVAVMLVKRDEASVRLHFVTAGLTAAQIVIDFGPPACATEIFSGEEVPEPGVPHDSAFEKMEGMSGRLASAGAPHVVGAMFPAASGWLGPRRVAALAASTLLVGMVCPGLHSIYGGLTVDACDEPGPENRLDFRVAAADRRFRLVRLLIMGGGLVGTIDSFARTPPTPQAPSRELAGAVEPNEFAGGRSGGRWLARVGRGDRQVAGGRRSKGRDLPRRRH